MCGDFLEIPVALSASLSTQPIGTPATLTSTPEYTALDHGLYPFPNLSNGVGISARRASFELEGLIAFSVCGGLRESI